ncbi:serine hydrolase domain-containing protein [Streptomyces tirandamycinicus]|uniref:serine hydrolase domain-containing protein n=1 Tax=Streptomyces tirandamycinicus TaxID=2174846 RepID=UPI00227186AF|nr:serine hydrolase domain-containing protein [Streptomyces tirandamycinicus]MCY0980266.1 serine hydrolase [Streptomyces tirandamycinicus]
MIRLRVVPAILAALLLVATGLTGAQAHTERQEFDPALVEALDKAVEDTMEEAGIPGAIVGIRIPGRGTYEKAFGVADKSTGTPMKTDLHMRIGSVTKTFTITGLLQLVDQGRVGLDDPVGKYVEGVPAGNRITLRQLAEMRSGLFNYSEDEKWEKSLLADPQQTFAPRQLLDYAFAHPLNFPPGSKWEYSNTNTILLGLVIEKVTGQRLEDYLRQRVYAPLRLGQTSFPTDDAMPEPYAHGYTHYTKSGATTATPSGGTVDATNWNPSWAWAAGAMISDLGDLNTWVPALADGRLLDPATQKERLKFGPTGIPEVQYGLGIMRVGNWIGHNGELPGYETLAVQLPSQRATLVILVNSDTDLRGQSLSTLLGRAVTEVVTPRNVFDLPTAPQSEKTSPPPSPTASPTP